MAQVHIGRKIKEVLGHSHFTAVEFAKKINKTRTVVYDIFRRDSIDTALLFKISKTLSHNFFDYYSADIQPSVKEDKEKYVSLQEQVKQLSEELGVFKKQLTELQKKNELLEKLLSLLEEKKQIRKKSKRQ